MLHIYVNPFNVDFKEAEKAYRAAYRIADNLAATAPLRLQIAYDRTLFYHTELCNTNEACCIAKKVGMISIKVCNASLCCVGTRGYP